MQLGTDSFEYNMFDKFIPLIKDVPGMTCEIGVREGGGSERIIVNLLKNDIHDRTHIMIDPYGNILYETSEGEITRHDYTNDMRARAIAGIYYIFAGQPVNPLFFVMTDTDFFERFGSGVPVYNFKESVEDKYAFIHYDGPHAIAPLKAEMEFFIPRSSPGSVHIFDDIENYDHKAFEEWFMGKWNFKTLAYGQRKAAYQYS
jgi:hypothetical protein